MSRESKLHPLHGSYVVSGLFGTFSDIRASLCLDSGERSSCGRFLSHLPYGVVWYNGTVMLVACAIITGVIVPALAHARAMQGIGAAYNTISEAIQEARSRQDMSALLAVMNLLPLLGKMPRSRLSFIP